jgi:glycosyltransferase involved in cell wall biosynthesis
MREKISACITACNEEANIRRCLESVKWADEIVVVDSFSADNTVKIAREYTDKVYSHEWLGYVGQKNLIRGMISAEWVLFIDADEEISDDLRMEIRKEFESGACSQYDGYEFPRIVHFLGKWITHGDWYPDRKLRLFRKDRGKCVGPEPHDRVEVEGKVKRLRGHLNHYTYANVEEQVAAANRFSSITAEIWHKEGKAFRLYHLLFRPPLRFLRCYFMRLGFLDGARGMMIAALSAYGVFVKYAKLWELSRGETQRESAR